MDPDNLRDHTLWWIGPPWLQANDDKWSELPNFETPVLPKDVDTERRASITLCATCASSSWDLQSRLSSWTKLLRVTAYIFRYIQNLKSKREKTNNTHIATKRNVYALHPHEIQIAKTFWIKQIQTQLFATELASLYKNQVVPKSSPLASLSPYLDSNGLIRVQGRLGKSRLPEDTKHPIILKSHPLVNTLITHTHVHALHAGPQLTLAILRQNYWLLRARATVRSVLYRCITCTRHNARIPEQFMGELPDFRVNPNSRAFVHTGVDYAGPLLVRLAKGRGHKSQKAYIAVFICMTTKALHLELVSDYSTASFLAAYQRFLARRGTPTSMYSDNGTTFQGADKEMTASFQAATRNPEFQNYLATESVSWHFLPPAAPHFGSLWEAAVRSVKHHLKRSIGTHTLTFEELSTLLCRIELFLNSRPIASVTDSIDDYCALTPGHFLIGSTLIAAPEPSVLELAEHRLSRWQLVQQISERVWKA
ncbi:PREDICTED: uncharacterized protein LOC105561346 [Vollenhovia emeryi]|uniref:uncharacterized protein LOC105561346 n=1 Tax=Vollenhovia emeryi TaxID=411798 RepID=UPI0005F524AD|nr:PREDICTED: uncharacterized protein LOC105561346 [Vollenhovia emeryi]